MWKAIKWIAITLLTIVVIPFLLLIAQALLEDFGKEDSVKLKNLSRLASLLSTYAAANKLLLSCAFVILVALVLLAYRRDKLSNLRGRVEVYKSAPRLQPTDIRRSPNWFDPYFIERKAVGQVVELLTGGKGVVLLGIGLVGKTRCAYEALRRMRGYQVLSLGPELLGNTDQIKIPRKYGVLKPKLILFLDDLNEYVGKFQPDYLLKRLRDQSRSLTVLATCRSGDEFEVTQRDQAFGSFVSWNLRKVDVEEISKEEEKTLAAHFKREWTSESYNGTPGSIVLGTDLMRQKLLSAQDKGAVILMRSLYLMNKAGIRRYRQVLAESTAKKVYHYELTRHFADSAWRWLKEARFLDVEEGFIVLPHFVYLDGSFCPEYETGKPLSENIKSLWREVVSTDGNENEVLDVSVNFGLLNDWPAAETGSLRLIELNPSDAFIALSILGSALWMQGKYEKAEVAYREAIRLKPDYPVAHYILGTALERQGKYEKAKVAYREAIRLKPDYPVAHFNLGTALWEQGKHEEAKVAYREAIRLKPDYPEAHYFLGTALWMQGKYEEAEVAYREAIRLKPDDPEAHYFLGTALEWQGKYEEAEVAYREAIRLKPDYPEAHYFLGTALEWQGKYEEAEVAYREAIRLKPDYPEAHFNLGTALERQGKYEEAKVAYREAIRLKPDDP